VVSCRRWWPGLAAVVATLAPAAARGRGAAGGRSTPETAAPLPRSGSRRGPRGPDSRRENARAHRTSNTGTRGEGAAVPGGRVRRGYPPSIHLAPPRCSDLRPRRRSGRGLELGPGRSRWPGPRDGGSSSVFIAGASGLGWLWRGSCHCGGLGGWRAGVWASC
jgi:hypothetical protein